MTTYRAKIAPLFVQTHTFWEGETPTNKPCAMAYAAIFDESDDPILFDGAAQLMPLTPLISSDAAFDDVRPRVEAALADQLTELLGYAPLTDTLTCDWLTEPASA